MPLRLAVALSETALRLFDRRLSGVDSVVCIIIIIITPITSIRPCVFAVQAVHRPLPNRKGVRLGSGCSTVNLAERVVLLVPHNCQRWASNVGLATPSSYTPPRHLEKFSLRRLMLLPGRPLQPVPAMLQVAALPYVERADPAMMYSPRMLRAARRSDGPPTPTPTGRHDACTSYSDIQTP